MPWLRVDDGFTKHPKILALTKRQRWLWLDLLCWCARYKTKGVITDGARAELHIRTGDLEAWTNACLIEFVDGACVVHDWHVYNPADPTASERMKRNRERQPRPATGKWGKTRAAVFLRDGGVCLDCGETSEDWNADHVPARDELERRGLSIHDITYIVTRCHSCHAKKTRREAMERAAVVTEPITEPSRNGSVPSRVGARARPRPVPVTVPSPDKSSTPTAPLPATAAVDGNGRAGDFQKFLSGVVSAMP